jgi:hypothetical protein
MEEEEEGGEGEGGGGGGGGEEEEEEEEESQISVKLIQAIGETSRSEIHKLINSIWNMEELPQQWKEEVYYCTNLQQGL